MSRTPIVRQYAILKNDWGAVSYKERQRKKLIAAHGALEPGCI